MHHLNSQTCRRQQHGCISFHWKLVSRPEDDAVDADCPSLLLVAQLSPDLAPDRHHASTGTIPPSDTGNNCGSSCCTSTSPSTHLSSAPQMRNARTPPDPAAISAQAGSQPCVGYPFPRSTPETMADHVAKALWHRQPLAPEHYSHAPLPHSEPVRHQHSYVSLECRASILTGRLCLVILSRGRCSVHPRSTTGRDQRFIFIGHGVRGTVGELEVASRGSCGVLYYTAPDRLVEPLNMRRSSYSIGHVGRGWGELRRICFHRTLPT